LRRDRSSKCADRLAEPLAVPLQSIGSDWRQHKMNWVQIKGQLNVVQGKLKSKWGKLTDDDLMLLKGKKDIFLGRLQERTGLKKEDAERELDSLLNGMNTNTQT
jgi:uncharacterized protein YjbJ (UPF0337 family)